MSVDAKIPYVVVNPGPDPLTAPVVDSRNPPLVSFCVPTKNNEDTLGNCLKSIAAQNYPRIEIIIIDGCSSDRTVEIARAYTDIIVSDPGSYGSACQTGFELARGEIIALFDSDIVIPHAEWLAEAIRYFNYNKNVSTVWPLCVAPPGSTRVAGLYQTKLFRILIEDRIRKPQCVCGGGNALFLRRCLEEIGGIDRSIHWGADFDWAKKLKERDYRVVFIRDPLFHDTMRSLSQFYKKQFAGARTFSKSGFGLMGMSKRDIFYENFILAFRGMADGLLFERDISWLYYPVFLSIRIVAYSSTIIKNTVSYT
jgi:glycosyltransferase involved in cell wall biosynthesis